MDLSAFAATFVEALAKATFAQYLLSYRPRLAQTLKIVGLLSVSPAPITLGGNTVTVAQSTFSPENISKFLSNPVGVIEQRFGWGDPSFDGVELFRALKGLFGLLSAAVESMDTSPPDFVNNDDDDTFDAQIAEVNTAADLALPALLDFFAVRFMPTTGVAPPGIEASLYVDVTEGFTFLLAQLSDAWSLNLSVSGGLQAGASVQILPPATLIVNPPSGTASGSISLALTGQSPDPTTPLVLFGATSSSVVQAAQVVVSTSAGFSWDAVKNQATGEVGFEAKVSQGEIVIDISDADGFLQTLLPADGLTMNVDFDLTWDSKHGFQFKGGAGLEVSIPLHLSLGPIEIDSIGVGITAATSGLKIPLTVTGTGALGPISAEVDGIGFSLDVQFGSGNLGIVNLEVGFVPPTGLGLSIDAEAVSGGGFVDFDPAQFQYAGGLELTIEMLQLKAFGLLNTQPEVSFVIIISADFPPITLGFGFFLSGVGGLLGINRSMAIDPLRAAFRAHTIDDIVFLQGDLASQAPTLVKGIAAIFPPLESHFVIGPFITITWGDPALLTAELGIIISLPDPVTLAILGSIIVGVPDPDTPLILLNLDVLGTWDCDAKKIEIDASLYNSYIAAFTIQGDSAFLLNYGESPSFALSVGGLNPQFQPPPGFPTLAAMAINLGNGGNPGIGVLGYFAVTSNSVQHGAKAHLTAMASGFGVDGHLGYDILIVFNPFGFLIDLSAELDILAGGSILMSIHLDGLLSGPSPWHIHGDASFSILFFSVSVSIDATFGQSATSQNPPSVSTFTPFQTALQDYHNWSATLPPDAGRVATLVALPTSDPCVVVHPLGSIAFHQTVVPLNLQISKFGNAVPSDATLFKVTGVSLNGTTTALSSANTVTDEFADGQFIAMSDQDKVSKPSYTLHDSGAMFSAGSILAPFSIETDVVYQTFVEDDPTAGPVQGSDYQPLQSTALALSATGPSANSPRRQATAQRYIAPGLISAVGVNAELYLIVSALNQTQRADIVATAGSYYEVQAALRQYLSAHPSETQTLQIIAAYELAQAA